MPNQSIQDLISRPSQYDAVRAAGLGIEDVRRAVMAEPIYLELALNREETVDIEARTVKLAFVSDKPIEHWFGFIKLSFEKGHIRTKRSARGLPLCLGHDLSVHVGKINNITYDKGVGRGIAKVSRNRDDVLNDIEDDILTEVSVGFMIYELEVESEKDGVITYICRDWEPYEASLVAAPKDISVGVGRDFQPAPSQPVQNPPASVNRGTSAITEKTMEPTIETTPAPAPVVEPKRSAAAELIERTKEIVDFASIFGEEDLARTMIASSAAVTVDDVRTAIAAKQKETVKVPVPPPSDLARQNGVDLAVTLPRHASVTSFKGEQKELKAYRFGQWLLGRALYDPTVAACQNARKYCDEHGLTRAMGEAVNETGGYTVLPEFSADLIDLREQYGVFRRNAKVMPMGSDTLTIPRRTSGLTPYFVAEAGSITASDAGWDNVTLVAKKLAVLARYSSEVSDDSIIDFANTLAGEIAYAFANKEDECGFNGDGTSTYGGIVGVREALKNLSGTIAYISGLQVGTGNAYSELVLADFEGVVARLPQYADTDRAAWFVHRSFYWNVMVKAMLAVGGVTAAEVEDARKQRFMGYRVEFSQVMPKAEGNSQVCALLGDLSLAATLGSRRETQIAFSEHSRFANDQIEIRGTERFDINVHDVGDYNATAASQNPGPIVGLITAAS